MGLDFYLRFVRCSVFIRGDLITVSSRLHVRGFNGGCIVTGRVGSNSLSKLLNDCNKTLILDYLNKVSKGRGLPKFFPRSPQNSLGCSHKVYPNFLRHLFYRGIDGNC